uniref:(California timema) hypothetical protein n=1 Tax=Timema californicum TaxID=61474 RepID=A0A7R9J0I8_TIMCA|nr:unnamed protein product [Timema californicum]
MSLTDNVKRCFGAASTELKNQGPLFSGVLGDCPTAPVVPMESKRIMGNTTGEVLINGQSIDPAFMANMSGFVPQQDLVVDSLSVREHMEFMTGQFYTKTRWFPLRTPSGTSGARNYDHHPEKLRWLL